MERLCLTGTQHQSEEKAGEDLPEQQQAICFLWPWDYMWMKGANAEVGTGQGCTPLPVYVLLHPAEIMPSSGTTKPRQPSWWHQQPLYHLYLTAPGASKGHSTLLHPERPQRLGPLTNAHPLLPTSMGREKRRDDGSCLQAHNPLQGSIIQA